MSSVCSAQGQVFHCKCRNQGCSSAERQVFHCKLRNQGCISTRGWIGAVASRCFLHCTLSLTSEQTFKDSSGTDVVVRRVGLINWAFWTSPKYTRVVKYQFLQGFWPDQRSANPNHALPPIVHKGIRLIFIFWKLLMYICKYVVT